MRITHMDMPLWRKTVNLRMDLSLPARVLLRFGGDQRTIVDFAISGQKGDAHAGMALDISGAGSEGRKARACNRGPMACNMNWSTGTLDSGTTAKTGELAMIWN